MPFGNPSSDPRDVLYAELAYLARYSHQPLSELLALSKSERHRFLKHLSEIVKKENASSKQDDD